MRGMKGNKSKETCNDYLETLEEIKKQYQQYVEVSELYKLPTSKGEEQIEYRSPSPDNPLTTNTFSIK